MIKNLKIIGIFLITILAIICVTIFVLKTFIFKNKYLDIISENTKETLVDPYLVLSIIKAESNFNENATSKKGACGLMQIMTTTASEEYFELYSEELDESDKIYDIKLNIILGSNYFSKLIKKYDGNYYIAIIAYNAGIGNVDKWIANGIIDLNFDYKDIIKIPFEETKNYTRNVINNYKIYKFLY